MQILRFLSRFIICILCAGFFCSASYCADNLPFGDVGEYGSWINETNVGTFKENILNDATRFQEDFQTKLQSSSFVPFEVRLGLAFMKALSSIDAVLQISLVRFTILFLFVMYAFWIALEAYKMIRETSDHKKVLYDIFTKGLIIIVWVLILEYGPTEIFTQIIGPIMALGTYFSDFILDAVANTYNVNIPDTCATIHQYVNANASDKLLIDADAAANIMCLPGRLSVYFYHATAAAFKWILWGFGNSVTAIFMGGVCVYIFIKCIFKYAFMTLGVVADLFLTLLMLPFTAVAESMPSTSEKGYVGKIFSGFLKIFNTKKLSAVIAVFINATVYFISLAIIIAICASILTNIISIGGEVQYATGSVMVTILCGCLVLYLADKADSFAKKVGGSIDNSFGESLNKDAKTLWGDTKDVAGKIYQDWLKKKST